MSPPSPVKIGPASGPDTVLEAKNATQSSSNAKASPDHEEHQYLDLIRGILENGEHRPDR